MSNALCKIIRGKNNSHENNLIKIKKKIKTVEVV